MSPPQFPQTVSPAILHGNHDLDAEKPRISVENPGGTWPRLALGQTNPRDARVYQDQTQKYQRTYPTQEEKQTQSSQDPYMRCLSAHSSDQSRGHNCGLDGSYIFNR